MATQLATPTVFREDAPMPVNLPQLYAAARLHGLDLAAAGPASAYNAQVSPALRLPDFGRADALVVVFGNTRALWPLFLAARARNDVLCNAQDPVDLYVESVVSSLCDMHCAQHDYALRFTHDPPERRVAFQRLADAVGLAQLGPAMLCVDPTYGPWIALRAAVVLDLPAPAPGAPRPRPCDACPDAPCVAAFAPLLAAPPDDPLAWIAPRDVCPLGRAYRYGPHQLRYHYLKDHAMLRPDG